MTKQNLHTVDLPGCSTEPLANYLKALGILRLLSVKEPTIKGRWNNGIFQLKTTLGKESIRRFFLEEYQPTPILSPWNGGSGFWKAETVAKKLAKKKLGSSSNTLKGPFWRSVFAQKTNKELQLLDKVDLSRLGPYRNVVQLCDEVIEEFGLTEKPSDKIKPDFQAALKKRLEERGNRWLETCFLMNEKNAPFYLPLTGTGGNDGNMEFTFNYILKLTDMLSHPNNSAILEHALFEEPTHHLNTGAFGQFSPDATGGFDSGLGLNNDWTYILMMEGTLAFRGSIFRKQGVRNAGKAIFPFTTFLTGEGYGSAIDNEKTRGEMWLPCWDRFCRFRELERLFGEGRMQFGKEQGHNGLDFAKATASLGTDRGINEFLRYGFLERNGQANLAALLGKIRCQYRENIDLLREIDPWLLRYRSFAGSENAPGTAKSLLRKIERSIFDFVLHGGKHHMVNILYCLSEAESLISNSKSSHDKVPPITNRGKISPQWIQACDDGSPEFRLGLSLASIRDRKKLKSSDKRFYPIRCNLVPVDLQYANNWNIGGNQAISKQKGLIPFMKETLFRRLMDFERLPSSGTLPVYGPVNTQLEDLDLFLRGEVDEQKIFRVCCAFSLIHWGDYRSKEHKPKRPKRDGSIDPFYATFKLCFLPGKLMHNDQGIAIKTTPQTLKLLNAGQIAKALHDARKRLVYSGLIPFGYHTGKGERIDDLAVFKDRPAIDRLMASILFPIQNRQEYEKLNYRSTAEILAEYILKPKKDDKKTTKPETGDPS